MSDSLKIVGWMTLTTLWGGAIGFALADIRSSQDAYRWRNIYHLAEAVTASSITVIVGAWLGFLFERRLAAAPNSRNRLLRCFALLALAVVLYWMVRPALQVAQR